MSLFSKINMAARKARVLSKKKKLQTNSKSKAAVDLRLEAYALLGASANG